MTDPTEHRFIAHAWVERDGSVLVLRRLAGRYLGGQWDIPGGTVEPGEDPATAAVRETHEEAGLVVVAGEELSHHTNLDTNGRPITFHTVTYRMTEVDPRPVRLAPAEHDDFAWVTPDEALKLELVWHVRATVEALRPQEAG